jgi:predicted metal-binding membrane protein
MTERRGLRERLIVRPSGTGLAHDLVFVLTGLFLFVASAAGTIYLCDSMSGGMPMAGGWTMSMAWMRMPGQTWLGTAASFMGMWIVMMAAMMLPSLAPMLLNYRRSLRVLDDTHLEGLTALAGAAYFLVWTLFGAVAYPLGAALAAAEMHWSGFAQRVPLATGSVLLLAGCVQLTRWKARQLEHCRNPAACRRSPPPSDARSTWQHGWHLGVRCSLCCSPFMLILLGAGVMNLGLMAILTAAITIERLVPQPKLVSLIAGFIITATAAFVIVRAFLTA